MIKIFNLNDIEILVCINTKIGFDKEINQDAYFFDATNDSFAISICDGLGSAKYSSEGSRKASQILVNLLITNTFDKDKFKEMWIDNFKNNPKEYNTTAKYIKIDKKYISFGGIGDGLIAIKGEDNITISLNKGEFSNQTSSIFDINYSSSFLEQQMALSNKTIAIICTDGFSEDLEENGLNLLLEEANRLFGNKQEIEELDRSLEDLLNSWPNKTNGDDKTIAFIAVRNKQ